MNDDETNEMNTHLHLTVYYYNYYTTIKLYNIWIVWIFFRSL